MNPDEFDIEMKKMVGLWPNPNSLANGLIPYIKRMKKPKLAITLFGDDAGENIHEILERVDHTKIKRFNVMRETASGNFDKNVPDQKKIKGFSVGDDDVVGLCGAAFSEENFRKGYKLLRSGGIIAGDNHDKQEVKDLLFKLRRELKIGTPINVANLSTWFWIKA